MRCAEPLAAVLADARDQRKTVTERYAGAGLGIDRSEESPPSCTRRPARTHRRPGSSVHSTRRPSIASARFHCASTGSSPPGLRRDRRAGERTGGGVRAVWTRIRPNSGRHDGVIAPRPDRAANSRPVAGRAGSVEVAWQPRVSGTLRRAGALRPSLPRRADGASLTSAMQVR